MKEEIAKTKWCPMAKQVAVDRDNEVLNSAAYNKCARLGGDKRVFEPNGTKCIGSDCMMWRWSITKEVEQNGEKITYVSETHGYCGLAK